MLEVTIRQGRRVIRATVATEAEAYTLQDAYPKSWMVLRPQTSWDALWAVQCATGVHICAVCKTPFRGLVEPSEGEAHAS